jgi:hypothetical protein
MALNPNGARGKYVYIDDKGNNWEVFMFADQATAGGFAASPGGIPPWEYGRKNMRFMEGVTAQGQRVRLPVATTGGTVWETATQFTINYASGARTFNTTGFRGERIDARKVV